MFYLFIGQVRNGKTVSSVCELKKFAEQGYTIYSNTWLAFEYRVLTRKMVLEWEKNEIDMPPKTVFFIDEIGAWFDSRNSANSNNKVFSYFINQLGKFTQDKSKGLTVIGTTQFFSLMDIRGRRAVYKLCEITKLAEKEGEWIKVLRVWKLNNNLVLKTIKREVVIFDKDDFALYNTQQQIKSDRD